MNEECDHESIRTGTAKELKEALKKHGERTGSNYTPWTSHKRACEGDHRRGAPPPIQRRNPDQEDS